MLISLIIAGVYWYFRSLRLLSGLQVVGTMSTGDCRVPDLATGYQVYHLGGPEGIKSKVKRKFLTKKKQFNLKISLNWVKSKIQIIL